MRLINTSTLAQEQFCGAQNTPEYGILSHCWGRAEDEVSYQQLQNGSYREDSYGWRKIVECCRLAQRDDLQWAWVDTCCIDKSSSAELTEAINSMFQWYEEAKVCYVFLPDFESQILFDRDPSPTIALLFQNSRWFTRGWTLQELLAPAKVWFFNQTFDQIGTKESLATFISKATGIHVSYLALHGSFRGASVAARMSWVAKRETTRVEDIAYCLLGLFDVNMPLLYGEGQKAFLRLQKAIIQSSQDCTIFAWVDSDDEHQWLNGILASNPRVFQNSGTIIENKQSLHPLEGSFQLTDRGLEYWLKSYPYLTSDHLPIRLGCKDARTNEDIILQTVRKGKAVYRVGMQKRILSPRERFFSCLLTMTIPSHFIYIATELRAKDMFASTISDQRKTWFSWVSGYTVTAAMFAVLFSTVGVFLRLREGTGNGLVALGSLMLGLEMAPLTARTGLPVMWIVCGLGIGLT